ncbi:MAG: O-antigen ligase family protein [Candidatus Korobacteraceae bacterium]
MIVVFYLLIAAMPFVKKGATVGNLTYVKYVGLACLLVAFLELLRRQRNVDVSAAPQSKWLVLFLFLITLSNAINGATFNFGSSLIISYWSFAFLFFMTIVLVNTLSRVYWSLVAAVGGMAWFAQYAIREWRYGLIHLGATYRPSGMAGDSNYFGVNLVLVLPVAFTFFTTAKKRWQRLFFLGCTLLLLAAVVVGASRGTLLGLMVAYGYLILQTKARRRYIGILLGFLITFLAFSPSSPIKRLLHPSKSDVGSSEIRIYAWQAGLRMISAHPLEGVGLGNYKGAGPRYDPTGHLAHEPHIAHNAYLEIAAEMGIPIFLVFVALLGSTFRSLARTRRRCLANGPEWLSAMALAMQAGLTGACVAIFFVSGQYEKLLWLFLALSVCLPSFVSRRAEVKPQERVEELPVFVGNPMLWEESEIRRLPVA